MIEINIKPLSVNNAYRGKRYKTNDYKAYEQELFYKLPKLDIQGEELSILIIVGFKTKASDIDNILKPFIDILQKKYNFNDNMIYEIKIRKEIGKEFIKFKIKKYDKR